MDIEAGEELSKTDAVVDVFSTDFAEIEFVTGEAFDECLDVEVSMLSVEEEESVEVAGTVFCSEVSILQI